MKTLSKKNTFKVFLLSFIILSAKTVHALPPTNDECSGAILVSTIPYNDLTSTYTDANTSGATRSVPNPSCITGSDNNDDIWYKFVAVTQTQLLRFHTGLATTLRLGYALYDGCGGTQIACSNQLGPNYANEMLGGLTPGNTYYLRFWSELNFTSTLFSFVVMDITPSTPANDAISATELTINEPGARCISPQFFTTASATRSSPDPSCNTDNDDDVWFQFIMPANGHGVDIYPEEGVLINTGAFANMGMEIKDATVGISVSCTPNFGVGSTSSLSGIAGHVYQIRIWTMGTGDRAVFSLCLQEGFNANPSNDSCAAATNLIVGSGTCTNAVTGNLYNSNTTSSLLGNPSCTVSTTSKNDVWYKATVPASGNLVVQTSATHSAVNDLVLLAYTNNCTTFTQIACDEDGNTAVFPSANHSRISLTGRTPGEIIYYRVLPRNTSNMGQFSICAFDESVPALPEISISDVRKNEGNNGTKNFDFTISLSAASANTVTVKYKTVDNSAVAPVDYTAISNTLLTLNPGETEKVVSVSVNGDADVESDEIFKVKLSNAANATIADDIGKGTIKNDDGVAKSSGKTSMSQSMHIKPNFQWHPNPVTDKLTIDLPAIEYHYHILLTDLTGRVIKQAAVTGQKNISINTTGLTKGMYLVKIQYDEGISSIKFVKY